MGSREREHTSPSREHCLAVKELYCQREWAVLEGSAPARSGLFHSATGSSSPSSLLPNCQAFPSVHADPDTCTHVPFLGTTSQLHASARLHHCRAAEGTGAPVQSQSRIQAGFYIPPPWWDTKPGLNQSRASGPELILDHRDKQTKLFSNKLGSS